MSANDAVKPSPSAFRVKIGEKVRHYRLLRKLDQQALAIALG